MKRVGVCLLALIIFGCAKVSVETKKPIKVDINMRIDVYQHVVKDVESINDEIYGSKEKKLNAIFDFAKVYASDLTLEVQEAIARRKLRAFQVEEYFNNGYIGENRQALLEVRPNAPADASNLASEENADREIIYRYTAEKNGVDILEAEKVFFQDDYSRAPAGWWFELPQGDSYIWREK